MPVPSQGHYGFHSFPVVDWFCLCIYLWVLTFPLLNCSDFGNFVITLIYLNILFGYNHVQNGGNCKKGDALRTTLVLKIGLKKFLAINFHQKMSHWRIDIDIIAPNFTNFTARIIFKFMFFMDGTQKQNEIVEESYHTPFLC